MADSIWKRDLKTALWGTRLKPVISIISSSFLIGLMYAAAGSLFVVLAFRTGHGFDLLMFVLALVSLVIGILGIAAGVLIFNRKRVGIPLAWISTVTFGLFSVFALGATLMVQNGPRFDQLVIRVMFVVAAILMVRSLVSTEFSTYMREEPRGFEPIMSDAVQQPDENNGKVG